jgi:hypothetical protein
MAIGIDRLPSEEPEMSKSKVMVIASALVLVASGLWADDPDQLGHLTWLIGIGLFVISAICLMREEA